MQVKTTHLFLWATLGWLLALMVLGPVQAYPRGCAYGRANRVEDVKKCQYGWEMDPCGNKVCTKGENISNIFLNFLWKMVFLSKIKMPCLIILLSKKVPFMTF